MKITYTPLASRLSLGALALALTIPVVAAPKAMPKTDQFAGTNWKLVVPNWYLGTNARLDAPILKFDKGRVMASVGCNNMSGSYKVNEESLKVGALISTKMSCGPVLDKAESRYGQALASATKWQLSRDGKILLVQTGTEPLVFERQVTPVMKR